MTCAGPSYSFFAARYRYDHPYVRGEAVSQRQAITGGYAIRVWPLFVR